MKITSFSKIKLGMTLAILASLSLTGCRSGGTWRMPGASMFAASREPDAATLAGRTKESEMAAPDLPVSPASKYSPDSIASVGTRPSTPPSTTTASAYGFPAQTVAAPKTSLAASANGYQTGPYQVGGTANTTASNAIPNTAGLATGIASPGYPSTYGGSYSGTTSAPDIGLPKSVTGALADAASSMPSYASTNGTSTPTYSGSGGYGPNSPTLPSAPSPTSAYAGYPSSTLGMPASTANTGQYPGPTDQLPAYPALPEIPTGQVAGSQPASSAYQGTTTLGGYTPGTTGRSTTYNFGPTATTNSATSPVGSLPPNTATSPSSALLR
jgi:hypothetical protein